MLHYRYHGWYMNIIYGHCQHEVYNAIVIGDPEDTFMSDDQDSAEVQQYDVIFTLHVNSGCTFDHGNPT